MKHPLTAAIATLTLFGAGIAHAEPQVFTSYDAFAASSPAPLTTMTFDNLEPGTRIDEASIHTGDISFEYDFDGIPIRVAHLYATTSTPNFLGTDDGGMFHDGDDFSLSFPTGHAIGLFFITADPMFDGDLTLSAGGAVASLATADVEQTLSDGSRVYFLGIIDADTPFTRAEIIALAGGFFLFNIDDVVTAPAIAAATTASISDPAR